MTKGAVFQNSYLKTAGWITATTTLLLSVLAIKYPNRVVFTEGRKDIPIVDGYPLVGATFSAWKNRNRCHDYVVELFDKLDVLTVSSTFIGMPPSTLTIDPRNVEYMLKDNFKNYFKDPLMHAAIDDLLGCGIFNAEGESWKFQRKMATTTFTTKAIRDDFTAVFLKHVGYMNDHVLDIAAKNDQPLDFQDTIFNFVLNTFMEIICGKESHSICNNVKIPFAVSLDACQENIFNRIANPTYRWKEILGAWFMPWKSPTQQHLDTINDFIYGVIDEHQKGWKPGEERRDLLSKFMSSTNEDGQPLNGKVLRDILVNFLLAAREGTSLGLIWFMYSLLTNPRVEKELMAEIKTCITDDLENDPVAMYETVKNMKYAHATYYESLRLNSSPPGNMTCALDDDIWPDGTRIKKSDFIFWSAYGIGRSNKIWGDDAKEFKPERWITAEGLRHESPGKWPVFNVGPRTCPGKHLGTLGSLVTMVSLLRRYEFKLIPNQEITYQVSLTLPMKNGMQVYVKHRL